MADPGFPRREGGTNPESGGVNQLYGHFPRKLREIKKEIGQEEGARIASAPLGYF